MASARALQPRAPTGPEARLEPCFGASTASGIASAPGRGKGARPCSAERRARHPSAAVGAGCCPRSLACCSRTRLVFMQRRPSSRRCVTLLSVAHASHDPHTRASANTTKSTSKRPPTFLCSRELGGALTFSRRARTHARVPYPIRGAHLLVTQARLERREWGCRGAAKARRVFFSRKSNEGEQPPTSASKLGAPPVVATHRAPSAFRSRSSSSSSSSSSTTTTTTLPAWCHDSETAWPPSATRPPSASA
jgi:hypothetical protein